MDQAQLLSIIGALYDKFVADVSARVESKLVDDVIDRLSTSGMLTTEINLRVQEQVDKLTASDTDLIRDIVRDEIESADVDQQISDWMGNNFDINTYIRDQLDISEEISDYLSDNLSDRVRDEVRDLSFSVTVD